MHWYRHRTHQGWGGVQAVKSSVDKVVADMAGLEQVVAAHMLVAATTWLRHVRSIATTYRMTARPPPSKPSHYAASLLRTPLVRSHHLHAHIS